MLDLGNRRLDGYNSDIPALQYYVQGTPEFAVVELIPTGEQYSMMFAKDDPLAGQLSEILTALKNEGFVAATHKKWFGADPEATTSTVKVMDMPKLN